METKTWALGVKQVSEGKVIATLARLGVRDRDGDVLRPGLLKGDRLVSIKPQHRWEHVDLGVAEVYEKDGTLEASMEFNLAIPSAKDWFESIRFAHARRKRMQYSFGFEVLDFEHGEMEGKQSRFLDGIAMAEVSPVLIGASVGSTTIDVKAATHLWPGMEVSPMGVREHVSDAAAALRAGIRQMNMMHRLLEREPPSTKQVRMREYTEASFDDFAMATESLEQALDALRRDPSAPMLEPPVPLIRALPEPLAPVVPPVETPPTADSTEEPMEKGGTRPIQEHLAEVLQSVEDATQRLEEVKRLRETPSERYPHGRPMSAERLSNIDTLIARLSRLKAEGTAVVEPTVVQDEQQQDLHAMAERFKQLGVAI